MPTKSDSDRNYWLLKTEPSTFSFDDLWNAPKRTTTWDGVRNFQARNMLRDGMKEGDRVFIYHSSTDPTGIAGIAEVARPGYPDETAFDAKDSHFDQKSRRESPSWYAVDIKAVKRLPEFITLEKLRSVKGLENMVLLRKGSRLSVQPVTHDEWHRILELASAD